MSVLARDIDAYQRAVEAYQRQVRNYNSTVGNYNDSFFTDANGNAYVVDTQGTVYLSDAATGQLSVAALPEGKTLGDFGLTPNPGNSNYLMLRQNPTAASTQTYNDVRYGNVGATDVDPGRTGHYRTEQNGAVTFLPLNSKITGSQQVVVGQDEFGNPTYQTVYTADVNTSTFADRPAEQTFTMPAGRPDPTAAQLRKLNQPTLAEQERAGLISSEIVKGGVLGGGLGRSRAGGTTEPPPEPPPPDTPYEPPVDFGTGWG